MKDKNGNIVGGAYTLTVEEKELAVSVRSSESAAVSEGTEVTLTAEATGGAGGYTYRFTETYNGTAQTKQAYGEKNSYTFIAEGNGSHKYTISVKDKNGNIVGGAYTLTVNQDELQGSVSSDKSKSEEPGTEVTLTAKATGGTGDYTYRFTETYNGTAQTKQAYSENNSYTFIAEGDGVHQYTVSIRDKTGNVVIAKYEMTVEEKPLTVVVESNEGTSIVIGEEITLTAEAKDGDGDYLYRFTQVYNEKAQTMQNYSEKNVYTFVPEKIGTYKYNVSVKDSSGEVSVGSYNFKVEPEEGCELSATLTSNSTETVKLNTSVKLTVTSSGGYGDVMYRFTETYQGEAVTKQNYSTKNTYSFKAAGIGDHKFTVSIMDGKGQIVSLSYSITVYSTTLNGIDVSAYQGDIDWKKVKGDGISFAMLRVVSGTMGNMKPDNQFYDNIAGATKNDIAVGVYRYGYAITEKQAQQEAKKVVETLKESGYNPSYPVAYDVEDADTQGKLSKAKLTKVIKAFKGVIEIHGYDFMIYSNLNWLTNKLDMDSFADEDIWIARYRDYTPNLGHGYIGKGNVTIWQYSDRGKVAGINGVVDLDIGFKAY